MASFRAYYVLSCRRPGESAEGRSFAEACHQHACTAGRRSVEASSDRAAVCAQQATVLGHPWEGLGAGGSVATLAGGADVEPVPGCEANVQALCVSISGQ